MMSYKEYTLHTLYVGDNVASAAEASHLAREGDEPHQSHRHVFQRDLHSAKVFSKLLYVVYYDCLKYFSHY